MFFERETLTKLGHFFSEVWSLRPSRAKGVLINICSNKMEIIYYTLETISEEKQQIECDYPGKMRSLPYYYFAYLLKKPSLEDSNSTIDNFYYDGLKNEKSEDIGMSSFRMSIKVFEGMANFISSNGGEINLMIKARVTKNENGKCRNVLFCQFNNSSSGHSSVDFLFKYTHIRYKMDFIEEPIISRILRINIKSLVWAQEVAEKFKSKVNLYERDPKDINLLFKPTVINEKNQLSLKIFLDSFCHFNIKFPLDVCEYYNNHLPDMDEVTRFYKVQLNFLSDYLGNRLSSYNNIIMGICHDNMFFLCSKNYDNKMDLGDSYTWHEYRIPCELIEDPLKASEILKTNETILHINFDN
jgi:hypothetical protein